jgi:Tfp pilus assembly PilM family ATPase
MSKLDDFKKKFDRAPTDVVALDCSRHGIRAVRMRKVSSGMTVVGAEVLPPMPLDALLGETGEETLDSIRDLSLPAKVRARHAALLAPGLEARAKLLRLPEKFNLEDRAQLLSRMGAEQADGYRVGTQVIQPATARTEALVLAAALPEAHVQGMLALLPKNGSPAPRAIGVSALAVLNAFESDPRRTGDESAHGFLHFDHDYTLLALFNQQKLSQLRTFSFGMAGLFQKVMKALNVDEETAAGVLAEGAFDVSHLIEEQTREVSGQYVVTRDFMERSENCTLKKLYVSGPSALAAPMLAGGRSAEPREAWNALDGYPDRVGGCMSERLASDSWCLTAAIGGCLGILEGK